MELAEAERRLRQEVYKPRRVRLNVLPSEEAWFDVLPCAMDEDQWAALASLAEDEAAHERIAASILAAHLCGWNATRQGEAVEINENVLRAMGLGPLVRILIELRPALTAAPSYMAVETARLKRLCGQIIDRLSQRVMRDHETNH